MELKSHEIITDLNRANRAFSDLLRTCLSHHGLTIPEWGILGHLHVTHHVRPGEIAKFLGVKPPFVAKILAQLESQNLITVMPYPDDERGKVVKLTESGTTLVNTIEPQLQHCLHIQFQGVNDKDIATYFSLNHYIADNVHHH